MAAFHEANAAGGVHGRKARADLVAMTITNRKSRLPRQNKLIDEDRVFALIGEVEHADGLRPKRSQLQLSRGCPSSDPSRALTFCAIRL